MQKAVALAYENQKHKVPVVCASGKGVLAEQIIQKAKEYHLPILQNQALVDSLLHLQINEEIPPKLYSAVVEVLIWLKECESKAQLSHSI